jgi:hypothetical protein
VSAKDIAVQPIKSADAHRFVRSHHYSGKTASNSQLHLGAFLNGRLVGVAQFGPPMDRSKLIGLVRGTAWNNMLELNRLAMVNNTPRNTESRFLSVCFRLIRKHAPNIQWVVSFADATQCGDGTIYRAAGFVLTGIRRNKQIWQMPSGETVAQLTATDTRRPARGQLLSRITVTKAQYTAGAAGAASMEPFKAAGARPLPGFQLRYVYFIDPTARGRLTVPVLPFSEIDRLGAGMYLGQPRARSTGSDAPGDQPGEGGAIPTRALQTTEGA